MAKQVLLNVRAFVGPADLTGQSNKIELVDEMEEKETTNYSSGGAKEVLAGVESVAIGGEGQWNAGGAGYIDDEMWANRRIVEAWTIGPETAETTAPAYLTQAVRTSAKLFTAIGEVLPWTLTAAGSWPLAYGQFTQAPGTALTADANGTGVQLGATSATQRLYASLHVLSVAGTLSPTIACTIQSATSNAFSSPTTRLTFTTRSTVGGEIVRSATGANAHTWYRAVFDLTDNGGTGMSFLAVAAIGIA